MSGRLEPDPIKRRDFLGLAGWCSAALAIVGSLLGMGRLPKPRVLPEVSQRFRLGQASDYPPGTDVDIPGRNVRVVSTDMGIAAMSLICTHLGCIVGREGDGFACPCHGSKFDSTGKPTGGPAPRALPWLEVSRAADGSVVVDAGQEAPADQILEV